MTIDSREVAEARRSCLRSLLRALAPSRGACGGTSKRRSGDASRIASWSQTSFFVFSQSEINGRFYFFSLTTEGLLREPSTFGCCQWKLECPFVPGDGQWDRGQRGRSGPHRRPCVGGTMTGRLDGQVPKTPLPSLSRPPPAAADGRETSWWVGVMRPLAFQSWLHRRGVGGG